jgi:hypothetical protein
MRAKASRIGSCRPLTKALARHLSDKRLIMPLEAHNPLLLPRPCQKEKRTMTTMRTQQQSTILDRDGNSSHAQMPSHTQATNNQYVHSPAPSTRLVAAPHAHQHQSDSTHTLNTHPTAQHQTTTRPSVPAYPPSSPPPPQSEVSPNQPSPVPTSPAPHASIPPPSASSPNP